VTIYPIWTFVKRIITQRSLPNVTYVVPVAVNYSYCNPDDGCGKYPKHVSDTAKNQDTGVAFCWTFRVCVFTWCLKSSVNGTRKQTEQKI
jgi:hypothetical protein